MWYEFAILFWHRLLVCVWYWYMYSHFTEVGPKLDDVIT